MSNIKGYPYIKMYSQELLLSSQGNSIPWRQRLNPKECLSNGAITRTDNNDSYLEGLEEP